MFKISRSSFPGTYVPGSFERGEGDFELLHQFCHAEGWSGDLSNGLFKLGEKTAQMHGLSQRDCGLLNLMRCYDPADRTHVLELFEQAATASSSFCYSTTILLPDGRKQPVFCVGESSGLEQRYSGMILGTFLFPRFQVAGASRLPLRQ